MEVVVDQQAQILPRYVVYLSRKSENKKEEKRKKKKQDKKGKEKEFTSEEFGERQAWKK